MKEYLDKNALIYIWTKIKSYIAAAIVGFYKPTNANTGWTAITPAGGASTTGSANYRYMVLNDVLYLSVKDLLLPAMASGTSIQIGTLPTAVSPKATFGFGGTVGIYGSIPASLVLTSSGALTVSIGSTVPASQELRAFAAIPLI